MNAVLTIAGVDYDGPARAAASIEMPSLTLTLDGYDTFGFAEHGCGPFPTFLEAAAVTLKIDGAVAFKGEIGESSRTREAGGWVFSYTCLGLKQLADKVSIQGRDGRSGANFNLPRGDERYDLSLAGLTVGGIVTKLLTTPAIAADLNGYGIGGFTGLPTTPALPAQTVSDLAALDVVPNRPATLSGMGVFNEIQSFIEQWQPRFRAWIDPATGYLRFFDCTAMPATRPLIIPGDDGGGHDVEPPQVARSTAGCATAVQINGVDIAVAVLSSKDGTLTPVQGTGAAWTAAQESAWTSDAFDNPSDAQDQGSLSSVTPSSCVVTSDNTSRTWAANFWNTRGATITLIWYAGGAQFSETKQITSCTALAAGGTATITWDASNPASTTSYAKYQILGDFNPLALVGRAFQPRDPSTGQVGLNCWVGSHLQSGLFPQPATLAIGSVVQQYFSAVGIVYWSIDGTANSALSISVPVRVDPVNGRIVATEPIVKRTASPQQLKRGYPTTFAAGKPTDFKVVVSYNRGQLTTRYPATGYAGRAFTANGMQRVRRFTVDEWIWAGDTPKLAKLAQEQHKTLCDPIDTGSILFHGYPTHFNPTALGYNLALSISGMSTGPWDGVPFPVRSVTVAWPSSGADISTVTLGFSNLRRQAQGDDMLLPPRYGGGDGSYFGGGYFGLESSVDGLGAMGVPDFGGFGPTDEEFAADWMAGAGDDGSAARWSRKQLEDRRNLRRDADPGYQPPASGMEVPREIPGDFTARLGVGLGVDPAPIETPIIPPPPVPTNPTRRRDMATNDGQPIDDWLKRLKIDPGT